MTTIPQVARALQPVLREQAQALGRQTGFVQRRSKVDGATFVQSLTFGWLDRPDSSLSGLCQMAATLGVPISPQGLEARFTPQAADLLYRVLRAAVDQVVAGGPTAVPVLARFTGGYLQDATPVAL